MTTFSIVEFVRGLTWHDLGKPFALQGWRHARLGYWLLALSGCAQEALVALRHDEDVRNQYFHAKGTAAQVPAITTLGAALDELAGAAYSLQLLPGKTEHHSLQNPFSRLPVHSEFLADRFLAVGNAGLDQMEKALWQAVVQSLPVAWQAQLTHAAKTSIEDKQAALPIDVPALPEGREALDRLTMALAHYPERTYPPMNDTTLRQHGRLTGILGFVVYRNLERDPKIDVQTTMQNANAPGHYRDPEGLVRTHLTASLLRITFEGIRQNFENAARVDDLLGALALTRDLRRHFKEALAEQLRAPELSEFLPISEGEFELSYLLPGNEADLRAQVQQAYADAIQRLATEVIAKRLRRDFPEADAYRPDLEQQWQALPYGLRVLPVPALRDNRFDFFAAEYGKRLLQAYVESQTYAPVPEAAPAGLSPAPLPVAETCDVCGTHPVWQPPAELDEAGQADWLRRRNFAAHIFRGEREQICVSCVARRELAFGAVAKRLDSIVHPMLTPGGRQGLWRATQPESGPALPPFLSAAVQLTASDDLADAGACFARYRRTAGGVDKRDVDLFPTVSYAADATGNVVLLTLNPTAQLYAKYPYQAALDACAKYAADSNDADLWQKAFADFVANAAREGQADLAPLRTVEPHLARVMERNAWIKRFYAQLAEQLLTSPAREGQRPLRVLPLAVDFPTLRLLLPADRLDDALRMLDQVVTETLFSATYATKPGERRAQHEFLRLITPRLLHGAVILFKHKFPLYLALEAERALFRQLAASKDAWYGFLMACSDLRGSLSEVGPLDATMTYGGLGEVLELVEQVDRPTLLQYAETRQNVSAALAQAQAVVRANRSSRTQVDYVQRFAADPALFEAVYFITRAIRR